MDAETIKTDLIDLISKLFKEKGFEESFIEYADLIDDLGMDSLTFISLIVEIENHFVISMPDEMFIMDNCRTIDDIYLIIKEEIFNENEINFEIKHFLYVMDIKNLFSFEELSSIDLIDEFGLDQSKISELVSELEEFFDISVPNDLVQIKNFNNVNNITDMVYKLIHE